MPVKDAEYEIEAPGGKPGASLVSVDFLFRCDPGAENGAYMGEGLQMGREEMGAVEDREIVELYLCRDETAISRTAEKFGARLRALSYGIVRDIQASEECENDTYMAAWRSIPPHEPRDYLYPFLARITRHISLNLCRDRGRLKRRGFICSLEEELEGCVPAPDDTAGSVDGIALGEAINGFLGSLSPEKRVIFLRRYWYMDSIEDIAGRLGVSQSKVKTTLLRCRAKLREYLEKEGCAP